MRAVRPMIMMMRKRMRSEAMRMNIQNTAERCEEAGGVGVVCARKGW